MYYYLIFFIINVIIIILIIIFENLLFIIIYLILFTNIVSIIIIHIILLCTWGDFYPFSTYLWKMERRTGDKIYLRNIDSEKMRNENDMLRLRQKLANERLKPKIVSQFQMLIEDDKNVIKNHYIVNNVSLSKNRSAANDESHITNNDNDDAVSPPSINFPADKSEDNTIENDSHTKHEQSDVGDDKMAEELDPDDVGIDENES